jgi:ribosomal protein L12E/L44/L45/RPP1/RPP2
MYVSEMLLQALLKLDSYDIDARWTEARKTRKEGIKSIQEVLDKVDAMKEGKAAPAAQADTEAAEPAGRGEEAAS